MRPPSVNAVLRAYLSHCLSCTPRSYKSLRSSLRSFASFCGRVRAANLTPSRAIEWAGAAPGWSICTRYHYLRRLKSAFIWATAEGMLAANPLAALKIPRHFMPSARGHEFLIASDLARVLIASAPRQLADVLTVLRDTGARPIELLSAEPWHYRPGESLIRFRADAQRGYLHKTARSKRYGERDRVIHLTARAEAIVRRNAPAGEWLFPDAKGGRYSYAAMYRAWKKAKQASRVRNWLARTARDASTVIPYGFRHSWITDALLNDVQPACVAHLAGTSVAMIQRHYSHVAADTGAMRRAFLAAGRARS